MDLPWFTAVLWMLKGCNTFDHWLDDFHWQVDHIAYVSSVSSICPSWTKSLNYIDFFQFFLSFINCRYFHYLVNPISSFNITQKVFICAPPFRGSTGHTFRDNFHPLPPVCASSSICRDDVKDRWRNVWTGIWSMVVYHLAYNINERWRVWPWANMK